MTVGPRTHASRADRSETPDTVRIEAHNEWAWCGARRLTLTPKTFAVLRHLVEHAGRLITKEELLSAVWRDVIVSDAALASGIRDLRRALGDSSAAPRYIQTVHRRGFRFIGPVARATAALAPPEAADPTLVGREAERARLHARLARALDGQRQLVFVTGEPGIGKTALVESFVAEIAPASALRVARGQCVEQYGAGEPYLPILEALGRLGRAEGSAGPLLLEILKQHAPTWLQQLPGLLSDAEMDAVQRRARGATRGRMLRELTEALDALTRETPLLLLLEDLHWSDTATIDLLGMLARRREASRLLVVGTYRPAEAAAGAHPLSWVKHELQLHGYCDEIPLQFLTAADAAQYLARRFPGHAFPAELALVLHRGAEGNPLFLVSTVDYLIAHGHLREIEGGWRLVGGLDGLASRVPETLAQLVEQQVERLSADERGVLEAGSVAGAEFSAAAAVPAGLDAPRADLLCAALARRGQFLRLAGTGEWPDGTTAGRYAFIHALYQQVLYEGLSAGARAGLHRRTAALIERGYGERAGEIAGELAVHLEHGRDFERAAHYRGLAGEHALAQHAYHEAAEHARRGLEALEALPPSRARTQRELGLQVTRGGALTATQGYGDAEVARIYARARELCAQVGDTPALLPVLRGVGRFYVVRGEFETARDVGLHLATRAEATRDDALRLVAHNALGVVSLYSGDFEGALHHLERGIALYDEQQHGPRAPVFRLVPPGVTCTLHAAWAFWMLGYPDRAAARARAALEQARLLDHPFSVSYACHLAAGIFQWRGELEVVQALEDEALARDREHGFALLLTSGNIHRGWLLAQRAGEEGLAQMQAGLAKHREIGVVVLVPSSLALMADVHRKLGRPAEGLAAATEALAVAKRSGRHYWEAESHRLVGVLTLEAGASPEAAESHFREAIAIARRQRAMSLELRAAVSLARLWANQGKAGSAHALLAGVHAWFTEGFDTADLKEAAALLDALRQEAEQSPERDGDEEPA